MAGKKATRPIGSKLMGELLAFAQIREAIGDPYGKLMQDEVVAKVHELAKAAKIGTNHGTDCKRSIRQIEGTMRFVRFKNEPTCSCCPGGIHVSGRYIITEPYITDWLWALCREIPEGDKVRISVEWEPSERLGRNDDEAQRTRRL